MIICAGTPIRNIIQRLKPKLKNVIYNEPKTVHSNAEIIRKLRRGLNQIELKISQTRRLHGAE